MAIEAYQPTIPNFILDRMPEIEALCREFHVKHLELFGSATGPGFKPTISDLDFLIEWNYDEIKNVLVNYFDFVDRMTELLGHQVQLSWYRGMRNPYLKASVDSQRIVIYDV